ncbi:MAG: hypothetical protein MHM6MM_005801 [Cercozoa sp. M6MM]
MQLVNLKDESVLTDSKFRVVFSPRSEFPPGLTVDTVTGQLSGAVSQPFRGTVVVQATVHGTDQEASVSAMAELSLAFLVSDDPSDGFDTLTDRVGTLGTGVSGPQATHSSTPPTSAGEGDNSKSTTQKRHKVPYHRLLLFLMLPIAVLVLLCIILLWCSYRRTSIFAPHKTSAGMRFAHVGTADAEDP